MKNGANVSPPHNTELHLMAIRCVDSERKIIKAGDSGIHSLSNLHLCVPLQWRLLKGTRIVSQDESHHKKCIHSFKAPPIRRASGLPPKLRDCVHCASQQNGETSGGAAHKVAYRETFKNNIYRRPYKNIMSFSKVKEIQRTSGRTLLIHRGVISPYTAGCLYI